MVAKAVSPWFHLNRNAGTADCISQIPKPLHPQIPQSPGVSDQWALDTARHRVTLSPRHLVTASPCHRVTLSLLQPVTHHPAHPVILSPRNPVILSAKLIFRPARAIIPFRASGATVGGAARLSRHAATPVCRALPHFPGSGLVQLQQDIRNLPAPSGVRTGS